MNLSKSLRRNKEIIKKRLGEESSIIYRNIEIESDPITKCCIIFINNMVDIVTINNHVLSPLFNTQLKDVDYTYASLAEYIEKKIPNAGVRKTNNLDEALDSVLSGNTLLIINGSAQGIIISTRKIQNRAIAEPDSERVVEGPREGFTESIDVNTALIRKRIVSEELKFKYLTIGKLTKTQVCVGYIESIAEQKIVDELLKRLNEIDVDGIMDSSYIRELIEDSHSSPFRTIGITERPDVVCAKLLEGRIAVLSESTPMVLTLPYLFIENMQANEDYYVKYIFASFNRILRWIGYLMTISVPAIYVALTTYHQEMIPTQLLLSISAAREGVPFPTIVEAAFMLFVFEVLREAGVRLPSPIGQTISIVGALVLGQAAVDAKIISAPMVIIVALTGISGFLVPKLLGAIVIIRLILLFLSSLFGLYGYIFGMIGLVIHVMSLRSFGIPFSHGLGSIIGYEVRDTYIRAPWWLMEYRPNLIVKNNMRRNNINKMEKGNINEK